MFSQITFFLIVDTGGGSHSALRSAEKIAFSKASRKKRIVN